MEKDSGIRMQESGCRTEADCIPLLNPGSCILIPA